MIYSVVGSGHIGSAIARQFAQKGIDVAIANARGPDSLLPLKKELGQHVIPQTLEAALKANMVILALPFTSVAAVARGSRDWTGKIAVDASMQQMPSTFLPSNQPIWAAAPRASWSQSSCVALDW